MTSQKYLVGIIFLSLLIWGPIDHSWSVWLVIRISYLIAIPVIVWFLLKWIWKIWQPNLETEDRLIRALVSATSGGVFVLAIFELTSDTNIGNTIILFVLCAVTFGYSISKHEEKNQ
jgi:hypothetical protein